MMHALPILAGIVALAIYVGLTYVASNKTGGILSVANGEDNRLSTSKFQFFLWTGVVVFTYVTYLAQEAYGCIPGSADCGLPGLSENLYLAMGYTIVTLATAKGITTAYINAGRLVKGRSTTPPSLSQLVTDDNGNPDLAKIQMLIWTVITIVAYVYSAMRQLPSYIAGDQLPDIGSALMILMGIGQAGYLGTKIVTSQTMKIFSLDPARGASGQSVKILGQNFGTIKGSVLFGDVAASVTSWADTTVTFVVPAQKADGQPLRVGDTVFVGALLQGTTPGELIASGTLPFTIAPASENALRLLSAALLTGAPAPQRIALSDPDGKRASDLLTITQAVVDYYDDGATAAEKQYIVWTLLYIMWWESNSATARVQIGGGPGRGLMQMEARTLTDLIIHYIRPRRADEIPVLASAAGTTPDAMQSALFAFQTYNNGDTGDDTQITNDWPPSSTPPSTNVAGLVSACMWDDALCSDAFGIALMREYFKHQSDQQFPYVDGVNPWDDSVADAMFAQWRDYWKRVGGAPYKAQFQTRMKALNAALGKTTPEMTAIR